MAQSKYIFVSGGVISGIGKGITAASIALLLKSAGYSVTSMKADPYLNLDAGTMNPIIHGETFVTEDGLETDQDIGHYERFLDESLTKLNYMTQGMIYKSVLEAERRLEYKGECVEPIRHIPEEIIRRFDLLEKESKADFIIVEIGGTVGEYQTAPFLEAIRQMTHKYPNRVLNIHVTYLPFPKHLGELKSKPAQQSVQFLFSAGIQPTFIVGRSELKIDDMRKEKISIFCNVSKEDIFSAPDVDSIYKVPLVLNEQKMTERILSRLEMKPKKEINKELKDWQGFLDRLFSPKKEVKIGIIGKYFRSGEYALEDSYICVLEALKHASAATRIKAVVEWLDSVEIEKDPSVLKKYDGIIVPQGWGSRGVEGKILTAQYAREHKIPYLGLCFGMQLAVVEFARNVLGYQDANTEEADPSTKHAVIHIMKEQVELLKKKQYGGTIRLGAWPAQVKKGTKLWQAYEEHANTLFKLPVVPERHRHRYEVNNDFREEFEKNGAVISATSPDGLLVEAFEIKDHPFFVGTQYHPELKSRPLNPHPLFVSFITACEKAE